MPRLSFRCPKCGGSECGKDAVALWNDDSQAFTEPVTMDQNWCLTCAEVGEFDEIELPDMPQAAKPPICSFLDLSTAHLQRDVAFAMETAPDTFPVTIKRDPNGFFVGTAGYAEDPEAKDVLPASLKACLDLAIAQHCTHVLFDNATAPFDGLPTYDW